MKNSKIHLGYKIIIPKEEPKQETIEEAAERLYPIRETDDYMDMYDKNFDIRNSFIAGAKWQQEQDKNKYSKEDMREAFENGVGSGKYQAEYGDNAKGSMNFEYFIEQFKKK